MANTNQNATVTITATTGPGLDATAQVFNDVNDIEYNFAKNVIKISHGIQISFYSYAATAIVTQTITNGVTTISIS